MRIKFILIAFALILLVGCSMGEPKNLEGYLKSEGIKLETLMDYLNKDTFYNLSISDFSNSILKSDYWSKEGSLKIESFLLKLDKDKKIELLSFLIIDERKSQNKGYAIVYDKEKEGLKIREYTTNQGANSQLTPVEFFEMLDTIKKNIKLPQGDYSSYCIKLKNSNVTMPIGNVKIIGDSKDLIVADGKIVGVYFMVYGLPLDKNDEPVFYVIPK